MIIMKRRNLPQRSTAFPAQFARGHTENPNLKPQSSVRKPPSLHRKIFVMKQTRLLTANNGEVKPVEDILMFDDHPNSLRIIFGPPANSRSDDATRDGGSLREFILPGIAILVALTAIFLPLF
jgi:hypothetical protein